MINREDIKALRLLIEQLIQTIPEEKATEMVRLHPCWSPNSVSYTVDERVQHNDVLYKVITSHTSQEAWAPDVATSLFTKVLIPDAEQIYAWEQPDSTNAYMAGDKVTHNEKTWVSDVDNNVWEPGVYGWTEVTQGTAKK